MQRGQIVKIKEGVGSSLGVKHLKKFKHLLVLETGKTKRDTLKVKVKLVELESNIKYITVLGKDTFGEQDLKVDSGKTIRLSLETSFWLAGNAVEPTDKKIRDLIKSIL